jgi:single-strand DNA-binding protein
MNNFMGIGNIGQDPELRTTPSGRAVTNFNVAIDRRFYAGEGNDRRLVRETDWIPVVVWGPLAENCVKYLQKGSKIGFEGTIRPRNYTDTSGTRHSTFEIVASKVHFLERIRGNHDEVVDTETSA